MIAESKPARGRGGDPCVVALLATSGDQGVAPPCQRFGAEELELACLVAAEGEAGEVVALDEQARRRADGCGQPVHRRQRRGQRRDLSARGQRARAVARRHQTYAAAPTPAVATTDPT